MAIILSWLWFSTLLALTACTDSDFEFTKTPTRVLLGATYGIAWTGAGGNVTLAYQYSAADGSAVVLIYSGDGEYASFNASHYPLEVDDINVFSILAHSTDQTRYSSPFVVENSSSTTVATSSYQSSIPTSAAFPTLSAQTKTNTTSITSTSSPNPNSPTTSAPQTEQKTAGLSSGAIVGIAIGSTTVILLLTIVLLLFCLVCWRRRSSTFLQPDPISSQGMIEVRAQEGTKLLSRPISYELSTGSRALSQELAGSVVSNSPNWRERSNVH